MSTARKGSKKSVENSAPAKTPAELQGSPGQGSGLEAERRTGANRRGGDLDRRAFWRPTPDRRREERELGRRSGDGSAT